MRVIGLSAPLALTALLLLSACDTATERAERHYKAGLEYVAAGDVDRALVEFRNVFQLDGLHHDARVAYAEAERNRGNFREAYSQYLRLIEQYPADLPGLTALSEMASDNAQWADAHKFVTAALAIAPDDTNLQSIKILTDYGDAAESGENAVMAASVVAAKALREKVPDNLRTYKVVIDDLIRAQSLSAALIELNAAIKIAPQERIFYAQRLSVHAALGDDAAVEIGLIEMVKIFPDAPEMKEALARWYLSRHELDKAEAFLRKDAADHPEREDALVTLIRFLGEFRTPEVAIAELDKAIAAGISVNVFRSARAGFVFDQGRRDEAIAEMQAILKDASDPADARKIKVGLARMQLEVGNNIASRALVEEVLAEDSGQIDAVKLKATWLILDDNAADAITLLRDAIDQNPRDTQLMTLMAQAYERDGNSELMRQMLSQAAEASGGAPDETLRYAQVLARDGKLADAETLLVDALRLAPANVHLLQPLGQIYVEMKDWPRADAVANQLESLKDPGLTDQIATLRASIFEGQQKSDEALGYLEKLAASEGAGLGAKVAVLRNHIANGRTAEAKAYAIRIMEENPDNLDAQIVGASVLSVTGDLVGAEKALRDVVGKDASREDAWMALFRAVYSDTARRNEAIELLDKALAAVPASGQLRWAKAGILEADGDIEGAISIYDTLYKEDSTNPVVANNLASLLSNFRKDPDSLKRAELIARRLRGSNLPPYQDTFGWIAYLNGNFSEAVDELEKAAAGMPQDPVVQYHLAMAYLAAGQHQDAAAKLAAVVAMVPADDSREFAISARSELEKLKAAGIAE